jgi:signal transduction histidine kinase
VRALRSQMDWLAERAARLEIERDQQASLAAAAERARIAREMHDVVSHNIQVMVTLADAAAAHAADPDRAADAMREVSNAGRQALTDMRRMLGVLRDAPTGPTATAAAGAPGAATDRAALAPQPGLRDLDALVERVRGTGLTVSVEQTGRPFELSGAAGLNVYRIVQEALTNALKHGNKAKADVTIRYADRSLRVEVLNTGPSVLAGTAAAPAGQDPGTSPGNGAGRGLLGLRERVALYGGDLDARRRLGGGYRVRARIPLDPP